jgi:hypothetical protein
VNGLKCPKCYLIYPDNTKKCYCGFIFGEKFISSENNKVPGHDNGTIRKLNFHGNGFDLFSIFIVNALLIIVTLGVYYFWGKVKIKRYLYSQLEFDGDRIYTCLQYYPFYGFDLLDTDDLCAFEKVLPVPKLMEGN